MCQTPLKRIVLCLVLPVMSIQLVFADAIPVANHSFEVPQISLAEIGELPAISFVSGWTEDDVDPDGNSSNTGIFTNSPSGYPGHIPNTDGNQLAFLGSEQGNGLWQFLPATYQTGKWYRLTVSVCPSTYYPLPANNSSLSAAFIYLSFRDPLEAVTLAVFPNELTPELLADFSVTTPIVQPDDPWVGKSVGIAFRAVGADGGFWDLDNVRVIEYPLTPNFDGSPIVNLNDLSQMAADWQSCTNTTTDVTGDGCVDAADVLILAEHWLVDVSKR